MVAVVTAEDMALSKKSAGEARFPADQMYGIESMTLPSFDSKASRKEITLKCCDLINKWVSDFNLGKVVDGDEAVQNKICSELDRVGLLRVATVKVRQVITHPDNREKRMLVAIDAQDLLKELCSRGWNPQRVDAMACELPPTGHPVRAEWIQKYDSVIKKSKNLLAPIENEDELLLATGRGSHTTAAARLYDSKTPVKGVHSNLCHEGFISQSKIYELQPTMRYPIDNGIEYKTLYWEVAIACPQLMEFLSRSGNSVHGTYRKASTLQHAQRLFQVASCNPRDSVEDIIEMAMIGMDSEFKQGAKKLMPFVGAWAGADGCILNELVEEEQGMEFKRHIHPEDLGALGKVDSIEVELFVPAVVKAMLNSPPNYADTLGYSTLFPASANDMAAIIPGGKIEKRCRCERVDAWVSEFLRRPQQGRPC